MEKPRTSHSPGYALVSVVKNLLGKLRQNPDIYPIRYYKKNRRFRRNWQEPSVK
jgi:hypothetical protein